MRLGLSGPGDFAISTDDWERRRSYSLPPDTDDEGSSSITVEIILMLMLVHLQPFKRLVSFCFKLVYDYYSKSSGSDSMQHACNPLLCILNATKDIIMITSMILLFPV
ncbi:hypothetical protein R6Q59_013626, partial [Mikania micrantha]